MSFGAEFYPARRRPWFDLLAGNWSSGGSFTLGAVGIKSGDLGLAFAVAEDNTTTPPSDTTPTGWTKLATTTVVLAGDAGRASTYYRICDGTENSTTISNFTNGDAERVQYAFLRPLGFTVSSVASLGLSFDLDMPGTAPATSSVTISGATKQLIVGCAMLMVRNSGGDIDLAADASFACTPGNGEGNLGGDNNSSAPQLFFSSVRQWRNGDQPTSVSAAIGDIADDHQTTFAAAVEIGVS